MQTFLPYPDYQRTADVLDSARRWKQCIEARQLVNALEQGPLCRYDLAERRFVYGPIVGSRPPAGFAYRKTPWYGHPAAVMWRGRVESLKRYHDVMLSTVLRLRTHDVKAFGLYGADPAATPPDWLGRESFHRSHRSNLLRKDPVFYGRYGWTEPNDLEYVWPNP